MLFSRIFAAVLAVASTVTPALSADDAEKASDGFTSTLTGGIYGYGLYDSYTDKTTFYNDGDLTLTLEQVQGGWTFGFEGTAYIDFDYASDRVLTSDRPDARIYAHSDTLGGIDIGLTDSALAYNCVYPWTNSENFGMEDLMTVGTCDSYDTSPLVRLTSPTIMDDWTVSVSYMPDVGFPVYADDVVKSAWSANLSYSHEDANAVTWTGSWAVEHAMSSKADTDIMDQTPTTYAVGLGAAWGDWQLAVAGQYTDSSTVNEDEWAIGAGGSYQLNEKISLGAEVAADGYGDSGTRMRELSFGSTFIYTLVPDHWIADGAFNVVHSTGGGADDTYYSIGLGTKVTF